MADTKLAANDGKGKIGQENIKPALPGKGECVECSSMSAIFSRSGSFSTATLPGLIQAYITASEKLPYFCPQPEKLRAALEDVNKEEQTLSMLQKGAHALNCIECLDAGELELLRTYLAGLTHDLFKMAENM